MQTKPAAPSFGIITAILLMAGALAPAVRCGMPAAAPAPLPTGTRQAVLVVPRAPGSHTATLSLVELEGGVWRERMAPVPAVLGRAGIAPAGAKREGDGKTPSGVFPLGIAFGYGATCDTRLPYRMAGPDDYWIDDPASPHYNRWVRGPRPAFSHERLRRSDAQYTYGIVVEYNTAPVTPGAGSAIFLHVWRAPNTPTAGCVALSETDMARLLRLLDPSLRPVVAIGAPPSQPAPPTFVPAPHLVEISGPEYVLDLRYNTDNNFLGRNVYAPHGITRCYLHRDAAARLTAAARDLHAKGFRIVLWDCYRPLSVQRAMWRIMPNERYVANPAKGSNHNRGIAVDCSLARADGRELPMPTPFDDFSERAAVNARCSSDAAERCRNRDLLRGAMERAGLEPYPSEWWHYQLPDARRYPVLRDE